MLINRFALDGFGNKRVVLKFFTKLNSAGGARQLLFEYFSSLSCWESL